MCVIWGISRFTRYIAEDGRWKMEDGTEEKLFFVAEMEDRSKLLSFLPFLKTEHLNCKILPLYHLIVIAMLLLLLKHCPLQWTHSAIIALQCH